MSAQEVLNVVSAVVLTVGGGGLLVFALSSWLGKVWAARILEKERSQYARELEALRSDYTRDVESLKADLARRHFDFQTRFAFYYQQRAEAIMTLYGALDMAAARLSDMVHPVQTAGEDAARERILSTQDAYNRAAESFYRRKIFFDELICERIEHVLLSMRTAFSAFRVSQIPAHAGQSSTDLWLKAHQVVRDDIPPVLKELETAFRDSLLVPTPSDAQLAHPAERAQRDSVPSSDAVARAR